MTPMQRLRQVTTDFAGHATTPDDAWKWDQWTINQNEILNTDKTLLDKAILLATSARSPH